MSGLCINEEKLKFWIFSTLGKNQDFYDASVRRAYRDFNRTLRGIGKIQEKKKENFDSIVLIVVKEVKKLIEIKLKTQKLFDDEHKKSCILIIKNFNNLYPAINLTFGQAQKWINMSLKYLYLLGDKKIRHINLNSSFFHVPIDNIIIKNISENYNVFPNFNPWSKLNDYNKYLNYQLELREIAKKMSLHPIEFELIIFNE